jgi:cation-transporting ATPase 13A3/4/5
VLVGKLYSCGSNALHVNIANFTVEQKVNQSAAACSQAVGLNNIPSWTSNPENAMWLQCPTPDYGKITFTEPVFVSIYTFYGSCFLVLAFWIFYKHSKERV